MIKAGGPIFITAIGTDSGKTLMSAIVAQAIGADYWKPIQAGLPRDTDTVQALVSREDFRVYPERYLLQMPASPHAAAKAESIQIKVNDFILPTSSSLVVEGAGGCLVPINDEEFVIDIAIHLKAPILLVANLYLGSINHTLLTLHYLKARKAPLVGIVFNGQANPESERIILHHAGIPCLLRVSQEPNVDRAVVHKYAETLVSNWK